MALFLQPVTYTASVSHQHREMNMAWVAPIVEEICVGMEVTSYDSADIDVIF